jgi:hypothetical protein
MTNRRTLRRGLCGLAAAVSAVSSVFALGAASTAPGAEGTPPTPEKMQAWASKPQRYKTFVEPVLKEQVFDRDPSHDKHALYAPPLGAIGALDLAYFRMFKWKSEHNDDGIDVGINASFYINDTRRLLTHSPDRKLNALTNKALDCVGDAFDNYGYDGAKAADRCEARWAKIEATLKLYGVNTGEPWQLSTL